MTEEDLIKALIARYSLRGGNGQRYAIATQVRSHASFYAQRTADFIAMDLWHSGHLDLHGHEVKVSRSDWLRELKEPAKADEFIPYLNRWWLVVADRAIVRDGELPEGWGLMAMAGPALKVVRPAPRREAEPLTPSRLAALLRAVAQTAAWQARAQVPPTDVAGRRDRPPPTKENTMTDPEETSQVEATEETGETAEKAVQEEDGDSGDE